MRLDRVSDRDAVGARVVVSQWEAMLKSLIHSIKHPPAPVRRVVKAAITRFGPPARRGARRARRAIQGPVLRSRLGIFLAGGRRLAFDPPVDPSLAVVVVVEGRADLLLACLQALAVEVSEHVQVILVDNDARGITRRLLGRIDHAIFVRLDARLPRPEADRRAVGGALTEFVALLDADCQVALGSVAAALAAIRSRPEVGAVGGKTIRRDALIEAAGSILWQDGSTELYGAGRDPLDPTIMFTREVDFIAGGFLLARRGSFPTAADPTPAAGFLVERIRLGANLRAAGMITLYDPRAAVNRLGESPSHTQPEAARLGDALAGQLPRTNQNVLVARHRATRRHRVLHIEHRVPHTTLGAGYPRANSIVEELVKLGYFVTFYPMDRLFRPEKWAEVYASVARGVEVMIDHSSADVGRFLSERAGYYDAILISRPSNMEAIQPLLPVDRPGGRPRIVYDAEALFSTRTIERLRHEGKEPSAAEQREMIAAEVALVVGADAVLAVSETDASRFAEHGVKNVSILSHRIDPSPTPTPFEGRSGFLFVGPVLSYGSPNADSIEWFATAIYPQIRDQLGDDVAFRTAGTNHAPQLFPLEGNGVEFLGRVPDLTSVYDQSRVFVAPTRFAAGIPFKCGEAAAQGVPIVATSLLANQLGWKAEEELLVADAAEDFARQCVRLHQDPDLWARIRARAIERVEATYSTRIFAGTLRDAVGVQLPNPTRSSDDR